MRYLDFYVSDSIDKAFTFTASPNDIVAIENLLVLHARIFNIRYRAEPTLSKYFRFFALLLPC